MGKRLTEYTSQSEISDTDVFYSVDVSDVSQAESGSTKKTLWSLIKSTLKTYFDSVTTTLTNKTLTTARLNTPKINEDVAVTSTATELNKVDGFTGTYEDLNYAKDLRATGVTDMEFDKLDGIGDIVDKAYLSLGYRLLKRTVYTTGTGTFTKDSATIALDVQVQAGGGGGGGAGGGGSQTAAGSGGGGGGYCRKLITSPDATYDYAVGAGGAGGSTSGGNGSAGGNSTFGTALLSATGGAAGIGMTSGTALATTSNDAAGGAGASGGDINISGGQGGPGIRLSGTVAVSGHGGAAFLGNGAPDLDTNANGRAGGNYGSGGGGSKQGSAGGSGGAGAGGVIIVDEYI